MRDTQAEKQPLERINLRLPKTVLDQIDTQRSGRTGFVSRNTWIIEAVQERLVRLGDRDERQNELLL